MTPCIYLYTSLQNFDNQVLHHHLYLLMQIEFPLYHRHRPPAYFQNHCRNIYSNRRSQSFCNVISWFCNLTWHIHTLVKKFSGRAEVCFDFYWCPREEKEVMFHRCQSASTPALGIQVCLNLRMLHLSSVPEQPKFIGNVKWLQMLLAIGCLIQLSYAMFSLVCYRKLYHNFIQSTNLTSCSARSTKNIFCSKGRLSSY